VSEADVIARAGPFTRSTLVEDLRKLELRGGETVLVHSSLSRLGYVVGGAHTVVLALFDAVGPSGTLVMPTHSGNLSDPARWSRPPVPEPWWQTIRDESPAYNPLLTPTRNMGAIVECFRHVPGVLRSNHPTGSFAAVGPHRDLIVGDHPLDYAFGETSPLARLYKLDASVLLLGVGHGNNTSLHLAEYRAAYRSKAWVTKASPVLVDGERQWVNWSDLDPDDRDFVELGEEFGRSGQERQGPVGAGIARLMKQQVVVDFAAMWFGEHRGKA
jgi:aminoglycoside 3-N-acetyltransferase